MLVQIIDQQLSTEALQIRWLAVVIQYNFPDIYFLCPKYLRAAEIVLTWEEKVVVPTEDWGAADTETQKWT